MELDQFKNIWEQGTVSQQKKDEYFVSLLGKRSNSPIARMKRNLLCELIVIIVLYGAGIVYYFLAFDGKMAEISWLLIVIGLIFVVYYYRKNKLLNNMQCVSCHVKSNLELQLGTLEKYVRFYLVAGNILIPVMMLAVGYIVVILYPERSHMPQRLNGSTDTMFIIKYLLLMAAFSTGAVFLNKWYVNRLYGRHVKKLKELLKEMKE